MHLCVTECWDKKASKNMIEVKTIKLNKISSGSFSFENWKPEEEKQVFKWDDDGKSSFLLFYVL